MQVVTITDPSRTVPEVKVQQREAPVAAAGLEEREEEWEPVDQVVVVVSPW